MSVPYKPRINIVPHRSQHERIFIERERERKALLRATSIFLLLLNFFIPPYSIVRVLAFEFLSLGFTAKHGKDAAGCVSL